MKTKILLAVGAAALVAGAAYAAMGRHGHGIKMMENMISNRIEDAADFIDADATQRQVIENAKAEIFKALEARAADRQAQAGEVLALLSASNLDVTKLNGLVDQKADDMKAVGHVVVQQIANVHASLRPEQRQKLIDHIQKKHARALQQTE